METVFESVAGFGMGASYALWAGLLSVIALILAINTAMAGYRKRVDGDLSDGEVLMLGARVLGFLIFIAWLLSVD